MKNLSAFFSGLLFSIGLIISGMTQPANIIGFLDFFGDWRPALALVMAGAVLVYAALHRLVLKRSAPLFATDFDMPANNRVDRRLIIGSAAFGVGWGLSGLCPGPAWVALGMAALDAAVFFISMIAAIVLYNLATNAEKTAGDDHEACG